MSDTINAAQAAQPHGRLRIYLIVIAIVEALEGLFKIPLLLSDDLDLSGKGWGGWAVMTELALTFPFAIIALLFLIKGDLRRAIAFVAGIGLLHWISLVPSVVNHPAAFPGSGFMGLIQVMQIMVFPLLMLMALALSWKNERLTLAGFVASLPSIANWLGVGAFAIGVAIYGF